MECSNLQNHLSSVEKEKEFLLKNYIELEQQKKILMKEMHKDPSAYKLKTYRDFKEGVGKGNTVRIRIDTPLSSDQMGD